MKNITINLNQAGADQLLSILLESESNALHSIIDLELSAGRGKANPGDKEYYYNRVKFIKKAISVIEQKTKETFQA